TDPRKSFLYPTATSSAFFYVGSYQEIDSITNGIGYWLKFDYAQNIVLGGMPRATDTTTVHPGWNMIGSVSVPVAIDSIQQIPGELVTSAYFYYDSGYHTTDTLRPHQGYWVKITADGQLVVGGTTSNQPRARSRASRAAMGVNSMEIASLNSLLFS